MSINKFLGYYLDKNQKVLSIMGPSGTGKSFSADFLCENLGYNIASQITTRAPRLDDKHYSYMSREEFVKLEQEGKILGLFSGNRETLDGNGYGYLLEKVLDELRDKKRIILFPSAYELEKSNFRSQYGTTDKIGLGFKNSQSVIERASQCNKELSPEELQSRVEVAKILTHIMEKYSLLGDKTFTLIYSDNGAPTLKASKSVQLGQILHTIGYNPSNFENNIEEFINREA